MNKSPITEVLQKAKMRTDIRADEETSKQGQNMFQTTRVSFARPEG